MDKKKLLALIIFLVMGFFMTTFANPSEQQLRPIDNTDSIINENDNTKTADSTTNTTRTNTTSRSANTNNNNTTNTTSGSTTNGEDSDNAIGNVEKDKFLVRFIDFYRSVLKAEEVYEGDDASDEGINVSDYTVSNITYTFEKWDKPFKNVAKNIDVNALYDVKEIIATIYINGKSTDQTVEILINKDTKNFKDVKLTENNLETYIKNIQDLPTASEGKQLEVENLIYDEEKGYILEISDNFIDYKVTAYDGAKVSLDPVAAGETIIKNAHIGQIIYFSHENKEHYNFKHYIVDDGNKSYIVKENESFEVETSNLEVRAVYEPANYTINYELNGGVIEDEEGNPENYNIETETFTLKNPSKVGFTFLGWAESGTNNLSKNVTIVKGTTGNKTYIAKFEANKDTKYTVNVYLEKLSYDSEVPGEIQYEEEPDENYSFVGEGTSESTIKFTTYDITGFDVTGEKERDITIDPTGTTVVNIYYNRKEYTVTFNTHDDSTTYDNVKYGHTIDVPTNINNYELRNAKFRFKKFDDERANNADHKYTVEVNSDSEEDIAYAAQEEIVVNALYEPYEINAYIEQDGQILDNVMAKIKINNDTIEALKDNTTKTINSDNIDEAPYEKDDDFTYRKDSLEYIENYGFKVIVNRIQNKHTATGMDNVYFNEKLTAKTASRHAGEKVTLYHSDIEGKTFVGYYRIRSGEKVSIEGNEYTFEKFSVKIYAVYKDNEYTVTFKDYKNNLLGTGKAIHGQTVPANEIPSVPDYVSNNVKYRFDNKWSPSIENVTGDMEVVAQYYIASIKADVVENGVTIGTARIHRSHTTRECVRKDGCNNEELNLARDAYDIKYDKQDDYTYTEKLVYINGKGFVIEVEGTRNTYTVDTDNNVKVVISENDKRDSYTSIAGTTIALEHNDINGKDFVNYTITDEDGNKETLTASEYTIERKNVTITANYKNKKYNVKFVDYSNNELKTVEVEHGNNVLRKDIPTNVPDYNKNNATFEFANSWTGSLENITSHTTITANYNVKSIFAEMVLDGQSIGSVKIHRNDTTRYCVTNNECNAELKMSYAYPRNYTTDDDYNYSEELVYVANKGFEVRITSTQKTYTVKAGNNVKLIVSNNELDSYTNIAGTTIALKHDDIKNMDFVKYIITDDKNNKISETTANVYTITRNNVTITASYKHSDVTVIFKDHDNKVVATRTVEYDKDIKKEDIPTGIATYTANGYDYTFDNKWKDTTGKTYTEFKHLKDSMVVTAVYKESLHEYSITYNLNGGTANNPITYNKLTTRFKLNNPSKPGYTFVGWNKENNKEVYVSGQNAVRDGDLTFTALYKANNNTPYIVNVCEEKTDSYKYEGSNKYTCKPSTKHGTTDTTAYETAPRASWGFELDKTGLDKDNRKSTTITADGKAHIDFYYNRKKHTVKYYVYKDNNYQLVNTETYSVDDTIKSYIYTDSDESYNSISNWTIYYSYWDYTHMPDNDIIFVANLTKKSYTVKWVTINEDGKEVELKLDKNVEYGTYATYANPTYKSTIAGYTYDYVFVSWDKDPAKTKITDNTKFTGKFVTLYAVEGTNVQLSFTKGKPARLTNDDLKVMIIDNEGKTVKNLTSNDYTVEGFSTSKVGTHTLTIRTKNETPELVNNRIKYTVEEDLAYQTKFDLQLNVTKNLIYTKDSACYGYEGNYCNEKGNVASKTLDYNFLEIVEHYDRTIDVQKVEVFYKDGTHENLVVSDSIRWTRKRGRSKYDPAYIAARGTLENTYLLYDGYYYYPQTSEDRLDPFAKYYAKRNYDYVETKPVTNVIDAQHEIDYVVVKYHRYGDESMYEPDGTFEISFDYTTNGFVAKTEKKVR